MDRRNNKIAELNKLRDELSQLEAVAETMRCVQSSIPATLDDIASYDELARILQESDDKVDQLSSQISQTKSTLLKKKFLLEARQIKLLGELRTLFPIQRTENGEFAIRGLELPMDPSSCKDDEAVASALGYVVHLVLLASKYLEVPLRYQLLFMGSRSLVRDPVVNSIAAAYPLFRKGIEKERFEKALLWLRVDIEQLMCSRGLTFQQNQSLLHNLQQLFDNESCPKLVF